MSPTITRFKIMNSCKPRCFTVKLKIQVKVGKQNQRNLDFVELHLWGKKIPHRMQNFLEGVKALKHVLLSH